MNRWSTGIRGLAVGTCPDAFVQTHRMCATRCGPDVVCGLWVMMACQWRLILRNRRPTPVWMWLVGGRGRLGDLSLNLPLSAALTPKLL